MLATDRAGRAVTMQIMVTARRGVAVVVVCLLLAGLADLAAGQSSGPRRHIAAPRSTRPAHKPLTVLDRGLPPSNVVQLPGIAAGTARPKCPWLNEFEPIATRVNELVAAMSPLQEATMLHLLQETMTIRYEGFTPAIPALCIPLISEQDGPAGVGAGYTGVTQLPAPIADAAAFDPTLASAYGDVIGSEDAATGVDMALAPTINIDRTPKWGRSYETFGEDPFLTASIAVPVIRAIQANRVVAVVKHFAVYNQETGRGSLSDDAIVSEQAMREIYLPAFSAAVQQANAGSLMCSYNLINGTPACEDVTLLSSILHQEWGFAGFVRSDCGSVYSQPAAMAAGVSQVKCTPLYEPSQLAAAVAHGQLPRATLDALIRPLLTVLFRFDLIASPHPLRRSAVVETTAHAEVARRTDDEGAVLLRNEDNTLPLDFASLTSLALIGPGGATPMAHGNGGARVIGYQPVTALSALQAALGDRLHYATGEDQTAAVDLAQSCQVAVVVVYDVESEGTDRTTLALPGNQDALVDAVAAANPNTIVVMETGSAVLMPWADKVPAILETWYPGALAGTSLVDLLSGGVDPSGKLPVTFPTSDSQMPDSTAATFPGTDGRTLYSDGIDVGYRWYETNGVTPAYSFGFGLSYTTFGFSNLRVSSSGDGHTTVVATITNTGSREGADIAQLYLGDPASTGEPPRQLRGFDRVDLQPGQSTDVHFSLTPGDFATWDSAAAEWSVAGGSYTVWVGDGSATGDLPLESAVAVSPAFLGVNSGLTVPTIPALPTVSPASTLSTERSAPTIPARPPTPTRSIGQT